MGLLGEGTLLVKGLSVSDFDIPTGELLGKVLFGNLPLVHKESFSTDIAAKAVYS